MNDHQNMVRMYGENDQTKCPCVWTLLPGYEVTRINIDKDRFLVAHTNDTLLVGDLETCRLSEVSVPQWCPVPTACPLVLS